MADTPNIHLALTGDADEIRNWQILDAAIRAIGLRAIIPEDLLIQGDLEVTGDTHVDGSLQVGGQTSLGVLSVSQPATFLGAVGLESMLNVVNGPVILPPGSIAPAALAANASIHGAQSGTANTAQVPIPVAPGVQLATLLLSPADDPTRWQLVIAQVTLQVGMSSDNVAGISNSITLTLRRGGTAGADQQSRAFPYTLTRAGYLTIPVTIVRVTKPPTLDEPRWSINATLASAPGSVTYGSFFAQVHAIQFA
jgi:hypothetical protein